MTTPVQPWAFRVRSPARANVIGEHVDYMGGLVMPCALGMYTAVGVDVVPRTTETPTDATETVWAFQLAGDQERVATYATSQITVETAKAAGGWLRYVLGAVAVALEAAKECSVPNHVRISFEIGGNVPLGAGLSSSASLTVAIITAVAHLAHSQWAIETVAKLAQSVEHRCCGVMCGIMDPFACAHGGCILLDCSTLKYNPLDLRGATHNLGVHLVIANSMVSHALGGAYNELRASLEAAEAKLQQHGTLSLHSTPQGDAPMRLVPYFTNMAYMGLPWEVVDAADASQIRACANADEELWRDYAAQHEGAIQSLSDVEKRRAEYVAREAVRTVAALRLISSGAAAAHGGSEISVALGQLLSKTHRGLADALNVSTQEIDFIQQRLTSPGPNGQPPVALGARLMGGGFGGCVLAFVPAPDLAAARDKVRAAVNPEFEARFGVASEVWAVDVEDHGARVLE
jgi:galactokinase